MIQNMPIALQLFSVRDELAADFRGTLQKVKDLGYEGVEFAGLHGRDPQEIRAMLDDIGLKGMSAHVPLDELLADIDKVVEDYKTLGCRYIAVPWLDEARRPGQPGYPQVLADIRAIGEACAAKGMTLLYHNHDFEFTKLDGKYALDILYTEVPADLLKAERGIECDCRQVGIPDFKRQARCQHLFFQRLTQRENECPANTVPTVIRMHSNVHHIGFTQNRLAADIARDDISIHGAKPEAQRILQFMRKNRFRPRVGKAGRLQCSDLCKLLCFHRCYGDFSRHFHFASYQLAPDFASASNGTFRRTTFSISAVTIFLTCSASLIGHSTINSS